MKTNILNVILIFIFLNLIASQMFAQPTPLILTQSGGQSISSGLYLYQVIDYNNISYSGKIVKL